MTLKRATKQDFDRIRDFYIYVIDNTENMRDCCRWVYGLHPDDSMIRGFIDGGDMYYGESDGKIVAAVAVSQRQDAGYHGIPWQLPLADDETAVLHILCCDPARRRQGLAKELMTDVRDMCRGLGKKAIRLDALVSNTPARTLYESLGYNRIATGRLYARNTGLPDFVFYEKPL